MVSLTVLNSVGPSVVVYTCSGQDGQLWFWNESAETFQNKAIGQYLTVKPELEVWAAPLTGGSQAVVLLNRAGNKSETITVNWSDIDFPIDHSALVRDLWARKDIGIFTDHYTSPNIDPHAVMMLNITLTK